MIFLSELNQTLCHTNKIKLIALDIKELYFQIIWLKRWVLKFYFENFFHWPLENLKIENKENDILMKILVLVFVIKLFRNTLIYNFLAETEIKSLKIVIATAVLVLLEKHFRTWEKFS